MLHFYPAVAVPCSRGPIESRHHAGERQFCSWHIRPWAVNIETGILIGELRKAKQGIPGEA